MCIYQNSELGHVKLDVAEVDSWTSYIGFESDICQEDKKRDLQNKGLWRSSKNMSEEK